MTRRASGRGADETRQHVPPRTIGRALAALAASALIVGCGAASHAGAATAHAERCSAGWPAIDLEMRVTADARLDTVGQRCIEWSNDGMDAERARWSVVVDAFEVDEPGNTTLLGASPDGALRWLLAERLVERAAPFRTGEATAFGERVRWYSVRGVERRRAGPGRPVIVAAARVRRDDSWLVVLVRVPADEADRIDALFEPLAAARVLDRRSGGVARR